MANPMLKLMAAAPATYPGGYTGGGGYAGYAHVPYTTVGL